MSDRTLKINCHSGSWKEWCGSGQDDSVGQSESNSRVYSEMELGPGDTSLEWESIQELLEENHGRLQKQMVIALTYSEFTRN